MSGSRFGKNFTVTTWGESHGDSIGCVVDGCPAGIRLDEQDIQADMKRRRPGGSPYSSSREEHDSVRILSGLFKGVTTGAPISMTVDNMDARSGDYTSIAHIYRPGHADYVYDKKYGARDYRGGGRASARETACRVMGGAVAKRFLDELGVGINAYALSIGTVSIDRSHLDMSQIAVNPFGMPDKTAYEKAVAQAAQATANGDSLGGVVECVITGLFPGVGEPVFDKLSAVLGQAVLSINAVKGVEFGAGFVAASMTGAVNNDAMFYDGGELKKRSNNAGGIYGGISDGSDITFRAAFKPAPSISLKQETITDDGHNTSVSIKGRHDPLIVPRAIVVVEAMAALALADMCLQSLLSNISTIKRIWGKYD
ncbi:MAG: chorismate synthase [Clostridiales bacterium]|jgi:chorismate synthase|nr:chorismate synthase [Clostridiales bacterium]